MVTEWVMVTEWALVTDRVINHALATKMWKRGRAESLPLFFLTFYKHSGMF